MEWSECQCRIFRVLGHPSPKVWPTLEQHFHWADNTGNIRLRRPDAGSTTLHEVCHCAVRRICFFVATLAGKTCRQLAAPSRTSTAPKILELLFYACSTCAPAHMATPCRQAALQWICCRSC